MVVAFIVGFLAFAVIDFVWIQLAAQDLYLQYAPDILRVSSTTKHLEVDLVPAALFYLLFYPSLFFLSVLPRSSSQMTIARGFVTGLVGYGTYSLTNHAIMKQWSWALTIPDTLWGAFLSGITAFVAHKVWRWKDSALSREL